MIKLRLILIGKVREPYLKSGYEEYLKRLSKYAKTEIEYVDEARLPSSPSQGQISKALDEEAERVLQRLKNNDVLYLADLHGKEMTSEEFASYLQKETDNGVSSFVFVIGSSYGLSDKLREKAKGKFCLSKLTFTHPLTLLLLLEQIYRAFKINSGETYQK